MADRILIIGQSGQGKSTSVRTLPAEETFVFRCVKKPLPFKGWKTKYKLKEPGQDGNMKDVVKAEEIIKYMDAVNNMPNIKYLIIDDVQYIMAFDFMDRAKEKGFEKFTTMAKNMFDVIMKPDHLREDLMVFFLAHSEDVNGNGYTITKMKTIGKMLDEKITLEGLFTVVLQAQAVVKGKDEMEYNFITQTDGTTTVKSPMGMFESKYIPNDLKLVADKINEYNNG